MKKLSIVHLEEIINRLISLHSQTGDNEYEDKITCLAQVYGMAIYQKLKDIDLNSISVDARSIIENYPNFEPGTDQSFSVPKM